MSRQKALDSLLNSLVKYSFGVGIGASILASSIYTGAWRELGG